MMKFLEFIGETIKGTGSFGFKEVGMENGKMKGNSVLGHMLGTLASLDHTKAPPSKLSPP